MINDKDFKIQKLLDGKLQGYEKTPPQKMDAKDLEAYKVLYGHLKEKPAQGLSLSFKTDVIRRIEIEKKQANDTKFYWFLVVFSLVGILAISCLLFVFKDAITPSLGILGRFKGFIIIGIVAVILFSVVERKLNGKALYV